MKLRPALALLAAFALALASTARAASIDGLTFPDSFPYGGQTLTLNGLGTRTVTFLGVKVYAAGLYLMHPSHDPKAILASPDPKVLILQYLHDGTKAQVEKEYREGESNNCGAGGCPKADEPDFERLVAVAPAVKVGDTTTYIITREGLRVLSNNRLLIDLHNPDLAMQILAGFIGNHPPTASLRAELLGLPH